MMPQPTSTTDNTTGSVPNVSSVFDTSKYAPTLGRKIMRAFELGPKYYGFDLPRYFLHRWRLKLPLADWGVFRNPTRSFRKAPYEQQPLPPAYEEALMRLKDAGVRISMPRARFEALLGLWWSVRSVDGVIIECGAFRGATSLMIALLCKLSGIDQKVLVLDTFAGMPAPSDYDLYRTGGELKPPQAQADALGRQISTLGLEEHVEVLQGLFAETFARLRDRPLRFSFVHIDANIYQSTLEACEFTIPRVTPGGAVIFDDYNGLCDLGARLAIDKYLADRTAKPVPLAECSAYLML